MNKEVPKIITEVVGLDVYDFQTGKVRRDGISWAGEKHSAYRIEEGQFKCSNCGKIVKKDDDVLPVFWENHIPSNFVCIYDRGFLEVNIN